MNPAIHQLKQFFSSDELLTEPEQCWAYGYDNSMQHALPDAVILPKTSEQIQQAIKICHQHKLPFTTRGRGTNTTGAVVPIKGGIVCVLENFNKVIELNIADRYIVVEVGITNQAVQDYAKKEGFFWAPDPTSSSYCTVGGNLGCNAGGPRAVKYGTCRENVLGLKAITGFGEEITTGVYTTKGAVGFDLTRLLIGSEGSLAVTTEAILKLTPLPEAKATLQAYYTDLTSATQAIAYIMRQPTTPCILEFIDNNCLEIMRQDGKVSLPDNAQAMLLFEVDGPENQIAQLAETVKQAAHNAGLLQIDLAKTESEINALWQTRKALSPAMRKIAPKKINEDVVVPVSKIPELIQHLDQLSQEYNIKIVNFGHAGNGNIHVNLLINPDDETQAKAAEICLDILFKLVVKLKGTLSGEHGIGLAKQAFVPLAIDSVSLELMRKIKQQFDPSNILNPGKSGI